MEPATRRLTLTHTALLSEHWGEYGPGAVGVGWELGLMGLSMHIEQPTEPMLDEAEFATSPEGKAFIAGSSKAWAQAAIDAGDEPDAARAAARNTTAFYTGESAEPADALELRTCETQKDTINSEPSPSSMGEEVLAPDAGVLQGSSGLSSWAGRIRANGHPYSAQDRIVRGPIPVSAEGASCSASAAGSVHRPADRRSSGRRRR